MPDRCNSPQKKSNSASPKTAASLDGQEQLLGERHEYDVDEVAVSLKQLAKSIGFSESEADELTLLYEKNLEGITN